jgi:hypothetical protein
MRRHEAREVGYRDEVTDRWLLAQFTGRWPKREMTGEQMMSLDPDAGRRSADLLGMGEKKQLAVLRRQRRRRSQPLPP